MKTRASLRWAAVSAAILLGCSFASAQVVLTSGNLNYSQNFNNAYTVSETAETLPWTNNSTIPGWYLHMHAAGTPANVTTQASLSGTSAGPIFLISHVNVPDNFALTARINDANGSTPATSGSGYYFGLRLSNNTGSTLTGFSLSFTGLQFYRSTGTSNNTIATGYQVIEGGSGVSLTDGSWTNIPGLAFTAPQAGGTASTLNFNTGNFTDLTAVEIDGLTWEHGDELLLRWYINNVSGVDQGVGIDNISFAATAIPEPSTYALMFGVAGLALAGVVRRRRSA